MDYECIFNHEIPKRWDELKLLAPGTYLLCYYANPGLPSKTGYISTVLIIYYLLVPKYFPRHRASSFVLHTSEGLGTVSVTGNHYCLLLVSDKRPGSVTLT